MLAERVYKFFIYLITTIFLFYILKNSDFLHTYLQGNNPNPNWFINYPCQKLPKYLDDIYLIKLSYHGYEMVYTLLFQRSRRDFPEYILHHLMTVCLVGCSYTINYLPVGASIMLVHDLSDVVMSLFKLSIDTTNKICEYVGYALNLIIWIYLRNYVFPILIILPFYEQSTNTDYQTLRELRPMFFPFLCALELLHIFWLWLMIKGFLNRMFNKNHAVWATSENVS